MSSWKRNIKYLVGKIFIINEEKIEQEISKAEVISFDIFDTLIKRNVKKPTDIHDLVSREFYKKNSIRLFAYKRKRMEVEKKARTKSQKDEITLDEIYAEFDQIIFPDIEEIKHIEMQMELNLCCPNLKMQNLYRKAISLGKTVIITSDMYLPKDCIEEILKKCGYEGYERLYLSSFYSKSKAKGSLFCIVQDDYRDKKILHIGDDVKADYVMAKKAGMDAVLIEQRKNQLRYWKKTTKLSEQDTILYGSMRTFLENHIPEDYDDATILGHEILAPMLLGFCRYLHEKVHKDDLDKVFFLSREGKIIMDAYKILYPDETIPLSYLYVSRQALVVPLISEAKNFDDIVNQLKCFLIDSSLKTIQKVCSLDEDAYRKRLQKIHLDENQDIFHLSEEQKKQLYLFIYEENKEYFLQQRKYVEQYLEENAFKGNVGIVDVGWEGTMQLCLKKLMTDKNTTIRGYYYGVRNLETDEFYKEIYRSGFLFEKNKNQRLNLMIRWSGTVFEFLFLNKNGSVKNYERKDGHIIPCFNIPEYSEMEQTVVHRMQETALNLLKKIYADSYFDLISKGEFSKILKNVYSNFAGYPSMQTVYIFDRFSVLNGSVQKMLPDKSIFWYLLHFKSMFQDFETNCGKIFFLKKLFKIPFPYFDFLYVIEMVGVKSKFKKELYKEA